MANSSVNAPNTSVDRTVRVYDTFYDFEIDAPAAEYDVVNSYFESVFDNNRIAKNFTTTLFRISENTNTPVLTLLQEIEGQDTITLTNTLAYYLNGIQSQSTLLGINATVTPNYWTARNILL